MFTLLNKEISPHALAIHNTSPSLVSYRDQVAEQKEYWLERAAASVDIADMADEDISTFFSEDLGNQLKDIDQIASGMPVRNRAEFEGVKSRIRNDVLGTLALSRLCRMLFLQGGSPSISMRDLLPGMVGYKIMPEPLYAEKGEHSKERRMHIDPTLLDDPLRGMPAVPEGHTSVWYQATDERGKLFVHRKTVADPSPEHASHLVMNELNADMTGMHTLFPYIPRKP